MVQLMKYLSCKHKDLSPRVQIGGGGGGESGKPGKVTTPVPEKQKQELTGWLVSAW